MAQYRPDVKYIASIYPGPLDPIRRHYGPTLRGEGKGAIRSTLFELKPVPKGKKPFVLEVSDCFEKVLDLKTGKLTGTNPVPVEEIVADLLLHWTGNLFNVPQGAKPGIIEIANTVPSQAEMEEMVSVQTLYFEYLFEQGEKHARENDWKEITDTMRLAAEWLGEKRRWSHRALARESAPCPFCTAIIPNEAYTCSECGKTVREIPAHLLALQTPKPAPTGAQK